MRAQCDGRFSPELEVIQGACLRPNVLVSGGPAQTIELAQRLRPVRST